MQFEQGGGPDEIAADLVARERLPIENQHPPTTMASSSG